MTSAQRFRLLVAIASLGGTALGGLIGRATGYEVSVLPLYALPIGLMAWVVGAWAGALLALVSGAVWAWADWAAGRAYSEVWMRYSNAAMRAVIFVFIAVAVAYIRDTVGLLRRRARALSGPIPVCTRCRRLCDAEGIWSDFETFLRLHTTARPESKVCPDCARRIYVASNHADAPPGAT